MFVYNVKLSRTSIFKALLVIAIIIFLILFGIAMYKIISASLEQSFKVEDNLFKDGIATLTCDNYTDVLKMVHNDIDTYIGQKIKFSGYVYKAPDFKETEFVLARNMLVNNNTQSIIVGFLCDSKDIDKYEEGTWVEITGEIALTLVESGLNACIQAVAIRYFLFVQMGCKYHGMVAVFSQ